MNIAQQLKIEGKIEGKLEELLKVLSWTSVELAQKYEEDLKNVKTVEELEQIEEKIKHDIQNVRK